MSALPPQDNSPADVAMSCMTMQEDALRALAQSSVADLRYLRVDESEGELRLSGNVRSFYHKQLAQETVRGLAAGRQVVNRVKVTTGH